MMVANKSSKKSTKHTKFCHQKKSNKNMTKLGITLHVHRQKIRTQDQANKKIPLETLIEDIKDRLGGMIPTIDKGSCNKSLETNKKAHNIEMRE